MAAPVVRELLDAGVHFGHRTSRWNPKMKRYLYGKRNEIHVIDIRETLRGLLLAKKFLSRLVREGQDVLFVGTKRQAREAIEENTQRCKMHSVTERWLGGTLTNFRTIRSRLQRLEELEALVNSPEWETGYSKKMKSMLSRELKKIRTNLQGIRNMGRLPGALVVVDIRKEINAVREAEALNIPTVCLVDSDSDPAHATVVIPGNDDAMRAIEVIIRHLADAVEEGMKGRPEPREAAETAEVSDYGAPPPRRRGGRRPPPGGRDFGEEAARRGPDTGVAVAEPVQPAPPAAPEGGAPAGGGGEPSGPEAPQAPQE